MLFRSTEAASDLEKDEFYGSLAMLSTSVFTHDLLIIADDFNAVSGTVHVGVEAVVSLYGSGSPNDNTTTMLVLGSN